MARTMVPEFDGVTEEQHREMRAAQGRCYVVQPLPDRKSQALRLRADFPEEAPMVFTCLDGKSPKALIWKRLRPMYALPFKMEAES